MNPLFDELVGEGVSRETRSRLEHYAGLLIAANQRQNLIGPGTVEAIWQRHVLDSAQILNHAPPAARFWLDVGSGAGLPGLVLALLTDGEFLLVEPRALRAKFLTETIDTLGIANRTKVTRSPINKLKTRPPDVITARAFATLTATLGATWRVADARTEWLLHKGRRSAAEVEAAEREWNASFECIPSVTDRSAAIVRVRHVQPRDTL